jgi:hypothetical protein
MKKLMDWERCEAATAQGARCRREATTFVKNEGALMPFEVCRPHKTQGEKLVATGAGIPTTWGKFNFYKGIL